MRGQRRSTASRRISLLTYCANISPAASCNMPSNSKAIFFCSVVLLHLVFLVAVHCATLASDQQKQKLDKSGKKAIGWQQSGKKGTNKGELPTYGVATEYGRINLTEASDYELQPQLIISKDRDLNGLSADEKKSDEGRQPPRGVNRLKRNVSSRKIRPSGEVSYVSSSGQTSKQTSKNYKKLKHAETLALLEQTDSRKNLSKKNSVWRRAQKERTYRTESNDSNRLKRNVFAESSNVAPRLRANAGDYYAQRKAIMERFYARQRQLTERLANQSTSTPRNLLWSELKLNFADDNKRTTTTGAPNYHPREDTANRNLLNNDSNPDSTSEPNIATTAITAPEQNREQPTDSIFDKFEPDVENHLTRNSDNVEREALLDSPANCDNIPRSGSFPLKRNSVAKRNCMEGGRGDMSGSEHEPATDKFGTESRQWGTCTGKVVYQHNLLLGLKGPSNLNTRFEVAIQGPICISCVDIVRYNNTRANVTLEDGGRGHQFITLRLKGFQNEGFSYIVKVWGVRKTSHECEK